MPSVGTIVAFVRTLWETGFEHTEKRKWGLPTEGAQRKAYRVQKPRVYLDPGDLSILGKLLMCVKECGGNKAGREERTSDSRPGE